MVGAGVLLDIVQVYTDTSVGISSCAALGALQGNIRIVHHGACLAWIERQPRDDTVVSSLDRSSPRASQPTPSLGNREGKPARCTGTSFVSRW